MSGATLHLEHFGGGRERERSFYLSSLFVFLLQWRRGRWAELQSSKSGTRRVRKVGGGQMRWLSSSHFFYIVFILGKSTFASAATGDATPSLSSFDIYLLVSGVVEKGPATLRRYMKWGARGIVVVKKKKGGSVSFRFGGAMLVVEGERASWIHTFR